MSLIDTHSHINFNAYKDDGDEVIKRTLANDTWMINVGTQKDTSKRAIDIAEKYDKGVYAAIGLHPIHLEEMHVDEEEIEFKTRQEEFDYNLYKKLGESEKVVAIGEIGLDYYRLPKYRPIEEVKERQHEAFKLQLDLAEDLDVPAIIHCREAHDDIKKILHDRYDGKKFSRERGVLHCFSGNLELANEYIELGFMVSFNGLITFNNSWDKVIPELPLNKIMIETDAPLLTPVPFRGKRNEPLYVKYVAEHIAGLRGMNFEEVAEMTFENALRLFSKIKK